MNIDLLSETSHGRDNISISNTLDAPRLSPKSVFCFRQESGTLFDDTKDGTNERKVSFRKSARKTPRHMGGSLTDKDYSEDEFMDANPANKILNSARFSNGSSLVRVEGLS